MINADNHDTYNTENYPHFVSSDGCDNWRIYANDAGALASIAAVPGCRSTHYGDFAHLKRIMKNYPDRPWQLSAFAIKQLGERFLLYWAGLRSVAEISVSRFDNWGRRIRSAGFPLSVGDRFTLYSCQVGGCIPGEYWIDLADDTCVRLRREGAPEFLAVVSCYELAAVLTDRWSNYKLDSATIVPADWLLVAVPAE